MINERAKAILEFCFIKTPLEQWFKKDDEFDNILKSRFMDDYIKAINNEYDKGPVILQEFVNVKNSDNPESLAKRVLKKEYSM